MKAHTVVWWLAFGVSAFGATASASDGNEPAPASSTAPAASSTSASPAPASTAVDGSSASRTGAGSRTSDASGPAKATLASWLDLLAAQRASTAIVQNVAGSINGHAVLVSSWPDYVRAVDAGRVAKGQIINAETIIGGYKQLFAIAQKASKTASCGDQKSVPISVKGEVSKLANYAFVQPSHTLGGWLPDTFNPWLAAVQTMVGSVKGISDALRPTLNQPSFASVGLADDDLYPAPSATIPEIYVPPVIAAARNGDIDDVVQHAQGLAGQMTQLASAISDRSECKALADKVTQSATALQNVAKALQPDPDGTSTTDEAFGTPPLS